MLQILNLSHSYGIHTVLNTINFVINRGERVGLVAPNGTGKTTLLRCIVGLQQPERGQIVCTPPDLRIGYLPQEMPLEHLPTVGAALAGAQAAWHHAEGTLNAAADTLAHTDNIDTAMSAYDQALAHFEALGGYEQAQRAEAILDGLGLGHIDENTPVAQLSGGQKTRLGLALLLLSAPDLLLLDEPTNYLDVEALDWLESFVRAFDGAALIVSHDRAFLDATTNRILSLDPRDRTLHSYTGNYSDFADARQHEHELHVENWKKQQDYVAQVETDIARLKGQALGVEMTTTPRQPNVRRVAKKVAKKARSRERKLERYLDSDERVDKPQQSWGLKLDFGPPPSGGRAVLRVDDVAFGYTDDLLFEHVTFDVAHGERIALVGPNGAGKTTLLRLLAGQLQPQHGTVRLGTNVRPGVMSQEQEQLDLAKTVLDSVRSARAMSETEARNFLHLFLFGGESVFRPVGACSLGERARLQLALLVLAGCNLLLLDEPLNHLDIDGREHFERALDAFEGTVIAVAHDRAFLRQFAERVIEVRDGDATLIEGDYDDYLRWRGVTG